MLKTLNGDFGHLNFNLIIPCSLLEGYGLIIIERVIASKAKQSFTVRLPRRSTLLAVTGKKSFDTLQLAAGRFIIASKNCGR
jgi:hypothetical protein